MARITDSGNRVPKEIPLDGLITGLDKLTCPIPYCGQGKERYFGEITENVFCLLYTSPSPRDGLLSRMPSSA